MAVPVILAAIARAGIGAAIKKFGKGAVKKAVNAEKKISKKVGSKKDLKELPSKMKPTDRRLKSVRGKNKGATTKKQDANTNANLKAKRDAEATNLKSGRKRIGAALSTATASTVPMFMGSDDKKPVNKASDKKPEVPVKKTEATAKKPSAPSNNMQSPYSGKKLPPKSDSSKYAKPKTPAKKTFKDFSGAGALKRAKAAGVSSYLGADGKEKAALRKEDRRKGESLRDFFNRKLGKTRNMMAGGGVKKMNMGGMATPNAAGMDSAAMMAMKKKKRKPMMPAQQAMAGGASVPMMKKGGKVRGAGIAKKGVRACKMR
jgi:hypothetical protein